MDITWASIIKVLIAGIGTYVVFPAALILRDYLLWKFINAYILNETLMKNIREYATRITIWNNNFSVNTTMKMEDGKMGYTIDGELVPLKKWKEHYDSRDGLEKMMQENKLYIDRKSNFLTWMLKHYKQDESNPINDWFKKEIEANKERSEIKDR